MSKSYDPQQLGDNLHTHRALDELLGMIYGGINGVMRMVHYLNGVNWEVSRFTDGKLYSLHRGINFIHVLRGTLIVKVGDEFHTTEAGQQIGGHWLSPNSPIMMVQSPEEVSVGNHLGDTLAIIINYKAEVSQTVVKKLYALQALRNIDDLRYWRVVKNMSPPSYETMYSDELVEMHVLKVRKGFEWKIDRSSFIIQVLQGSIKVNGQIIESGELHPDFPLSMNSPHLFVCNKEVEILAHSNYSLVQIIKISV